MNSYIILILFFLTIVEKYAYSDTGLDATTTTQFVCFPNRTSKMYTVVGWEKLEYIKIVMFQFDL